MLPGEKQRISVTFCTNINNENLYSILQTIQPSRTVVDQNKISTTNLVEQNCTALNHGIEKGHQIFFSISRLTFLVNNLE